MPKARQTCTRCSMRRQKCDRGNPCSRCVAAGVAASCTTVWKDGYDPAIHRQYLRSKPTSARSPGGSSSSPTHRTSVTSLSARPVVKSPQQIADWSAEDDPDEIEVSAARNHSNQHDVDIAGRNLDLRRLQSLLPTIVKANQLVEYYLKNLSWYHYCLSVAGFRKEFSQATTATGVIRLEALDLRWGALLFAILAASLTCTDNETAQSWGFTDTQKRTLRDKWFDASLSCLNLARYMSRPHVNSIQAISVLALSAHNLGQSTEQFTLYGVAIRLAQTLGLHRISYNEELDSLENMTDARREIVLKREVQRRMWAQLVIHDGNSTVSTHMRLLQPLHSPSSYPRKIDDLTLTYVPDFLPTPEEWNKWLFDITNIVAECNDILCSVSDQTERYRLVLTLDSRMRGLELPPSFAQSGSTGWARWAYQESMIIRSNKIAYLHRPFFGLSFVDARFAYSRWASLEASRTVIRTIDEAWTGEPKRPCIWNDQAHMVGACITLCLDNYQRAAHDPEVGENRQYLDRALRLLHEREDSYLSVSGARVIASLRKGPSRLKQARSNYQSTSDTKLTWPLESRDAIEDLIENGGPLKSISPGMPEEHVRTPQQSSDGDYMDLEIGPDDDILGDLSWIDLIPDSFQPDMTNVTVVENGPGTIPPGWGSTMPK